MYARIVGPFRGEDQEESEIAEEIERAGCESIDRRGTLPMCIKAGECTKTISGNTDRA